MTVGGVKSMIFGGEGLFFARLRGPGHVWLQSLPFSRLAGRIMANLGPRGRRTDEGSGARPTGRHLARQLSAKKFALHACNRGRISFAEFISTNDSH